MADHLNVDPEVLHSIATSIDDASIRVDGASLPGSVDGGIASADIALLLSALSQDLGTIAGGMDAMARGVLESRKLYLDRDAEAAEAIFREGGGG